MSWNSLSEFLAMGGYAFHVWASFAVTAALVVIEPLLLRSRRRAALDEISREIAARNQGEP